MMKKLCYCLPFLLLACNSQPDTKQDTALTINYNHNVTPETGINMLEPNWAYRFDPNDKDWITEVTKRNYVTLCRKADNFAITEDKISLSYDVDECTNDSTVSFTSSLSEESILILSGLKAYNKNVLKNYLKEDTYIEPGTMLNFTHNGIEYTLTARADTVGSEDKDDWEAVRNYELIFSNGKTEQVLTSIERFENTMLQALFIGDIDGDNIPDILVNATNNYEFRNIILFLSSLAKQGELVHLSATDSRWFDC